MQAILKYFLLITGVTLLLAACNKVDDLPVYGNGTAPALTASATTVAPAPADSNNVALTLSWTDPKYAATSSKYIIEIDSAGKGFSKASTKIVTDSLKTSFTAKELNNILLNYGYAFNVPVDMDVRLISSYANNNERLTSNTIRIKMTPYKVPPKVALPTTFKLFITGDAADAGWVNPVPAPAQEFSRLDETTWAGIFHLTGGKEFLILPENGNWGKKFALQDNSIAGINAGGSFGYHVDGQPAPDVYTQNFKGPATTGMYRIVLDFQQGKFTITPYTGVLPTNLFIVGNATPGGDATGWNNPVPVPSQQFTRLNSSEWKITLPLIGGKEYLLLPVNGDWSHKYAVPNNGLAGLKQGGEFGYDAAQNFPGPSASGTYTINVNFAAPTTTAGSSGRFTVQ